MSTPDEQAEGRRFEQSVPPGQAQPPQDPHHGYPPPGAGYGTPYGADPYGQPPYPQSPYSQQPYAQQPYPQQPYPQQPGPYGAPPYGPGYPGYGRVYPRNDLGVWSLVLALAGVALGFTFLTGIPAIIIGKRARQAVTRGEADNDGVAVAGIVVGWIATALGALLVVGIVIAIVVGVAASSHRVY